MKRATLKKAALSLMAVATLMAVAGSMTPSYAQWGWGRGRDNDRYDNRRDRRDDWDRGNRGRYDNDGYYGRNNGRNGGFANREQEKGYRDGLDRGQKDRATNRIPDPNNSSHYRNGNADYRLGFRRGYDDAYPRNYGYNNRRRW